MQKKIKTWRYREKGIGKFYILELVGKIVKQTWVVVGSFRQGKEIKERFITEEEALATYDLYYIKAEERAGRIYIPPKAQKLFGGFKEIAKDTPKPPHTNMGNVIRPKFKDTTDPEDRNLQLIKMKKINKYIKEYQEDIKFYGLNIGKVTNEYREKLQRFYELLIEGKIR